MYSARNSPVRELLQISEHSNNNIGEILEYH
jgi:hypothetical protein